MKTGDKVKIVRLIEPWEDDEYSPDYLIGKHGTIVGIAPETCCGLPMCPYDVKLDISGEIIYMEEEELGLV